MPKLGGADVHCRRSSLSCLENEGDALPEEKERIFEAFVSSQKSTENLGLGLFVAQSIALNHGGKITAEDLRQGRGARFVVRLPEAGGKMRGAEEGDLPMVAVNRAQSADERQAQ